MRRTDAMPDINWLIAAQRRFLEAMPPAMTPAVRSAIFATISERLAARERKGK